MKLTYRIRLFVALFPGNTATEIAHKLGEKTGIVAGILHRLAVKEQTLARKKNTKGTWVYREPWT